MRILIISDTHGNQKYMSEVLSKEQYDTIIHCGDVGLDLETVSNMHVVCGNIDVGGKFPEELLLNMDGKKIYVTHGHQYQVKQRIDKLYNRAAELGAEILCFGHTHFPGYEVIDDILFINPGGLVRGRGKYKSTYAILDTELMAVNIYHLERE